MARGMDVLQMLRPEGGWVIYGDDFDSIIYDQGVTPLTKKEFTDGFAAFDSWQSQQLAAKEAEKNALLARLGITAEEAKLLLS